MSRPHRPPPVPVHPRPGALADPEPRRQPWTGNRYAFTSGYPITGIEIDGHFCDGCGLDTVAGSTVGCSYSTIGVCGGSYTEAEAHKQYQIRTTACSSMAVRTSLPQWCNQDFTPLVWPINASSGAERERVGQRPHSSTTPRPHHQTDGWLITCPRTESPQRD